MPAHPPAPILQGSKIILFSLGFFAVNYLIRFIPVSIINWSSFVPVQQLTDLDPAGVAAVNARVEFMLISAAVVLLVLGMYLVVLGRETFRLVTGGTAAVRIRKRGHFVMGGLMLFAALGYVFFVSGSFESQPKVTGTAYWLRGLIASFLNWFTFVVTLLFLLDSQKTQAAFDYGQG